MAFTKIVKNDSGSEKTWAGITLADQETYEVPAVYWAAWILDPTIIADITSGDLVVNDGTTDLSVSEGLNWIKLYQSDRAEDLSFDNSVAMLDGDPDNVQEAIEKVKGFRVQPVQFQYIGQMNYDQYLYSGVDAVSGLLSGSRRSGDASNGYRYGNSAPLTALYNGKVVSAAASITGIAVSTGSPASSIELKFELWKVGFNGQGSVLGDIIFNIDSGSYTIGNYWNSSILTAFAENQAQDVDVSAGDLLGLKFIRQTGSDKVVAVTNATIVLEIEGNAS